MRIVVLTQQDRFFIPRNIEKTMKVAKIIEIVNVDCNSSLNNRPSDFLKWFGLLQTIKMSLYYGKRILEGFIDVLIGYRLFGGYCSIKHIAMKYKVPYKIVDDVNSPEFVEHIKKLAPDLIISYSAPQVIKEPLLSNPKYGIINVHGSLLPDYRGCLPSFWYLYNEEKHAGATVHYMSSKIDDGEIIVQEKVNIEDCRTMFEVMKRTKQLGGELMVKAIQLVSSGVVKTRPNLLEQGRYFGWATKEQSKEFRNKGLKLI